MYVKSFWEMVPVVDTKILNVVKEQTKLIKLKNLV